MGAFRKIKTRIEEGAYRIVLSVPERRNAIGTEMTNELLHALERADQSKEASVVIIEGEGSAFCAGGDFSQMTGESDNGPKLEHKGDYADLLIRMVRFEKPIIAKVNGHAMGGGLGLVAASTFAIASTEAKLGTPEINVGLFPMMIMAVLARIVPRRRLVEMMLVGERMTGKEAVELGIVNRAVEPSELESAVRALAGKLGEKSPLTMRLGLRAFADQADQSLEDALPMLRDRLAECLGTNDAQEGLMAFLQKRQPNWTGT